MPFLTAARSSCSRIHYHNKKNNYMNGIRSLVLLQRCFTYSSGRPSCHHRIKIRRRHGEVTTAKGKCNSSSSGSSVRRYTASTSTETTTTAGNMNQNQNKKKWARRALWTLGGLLTTGVAVYFLRQDIEYIDVAHGAHEAVPTLALHPKAGGAKDLPIVTHQLDDDSPEALEKLNKPRVVVLGGGKGNNTKYILMLNLI